MSSKINTIGQYTVDQSPMIIAITKKGEKEKRSIHYRLNMAQTIKFKWF